MSVPRAAVSVLLALALGAVAVQQAAAQESTAVPATARAEPPAVTRHVRQSAIEGRVQLMARELDLDERQQAELRRILIQQKTETGKAWSDESLPAPMRIAATRAIGDRAAERIRAMLNEGQREKYNKAAPVRPDAGQSPSKVDSWIGAVGNR